MTTTIEYITLEVADIDSAKRFYDRAFGLGDLLRFRASTAPTSGFRGCVLSLVVADSAVVDSFLGPAIEAGAKEIKPAKKSFWGYGGVIEAPDGTIWKVATSKKKPTGAPLRVTDDVVLLLGADDVAASKQFYIEHGFEVAKSYGRKYVQFTQPAQGITLGLYGRKGLAKDAGVDIEGSGSHRLVIGAGNSATTDPDGFGFQAATSPN
ncbi:glyoxalase [Aldersonia sp. NBC_00410]|uniref:glyoxalase n=1 Tax=Aldersonia sp. NBC_00410 TaxID=2975954 RepID=UPI002250F1B1|nr:glyoxalase [Aldersonia sp. NBC_00410]MCX5044975.1 glyoxalase [Aldersonia sp. NBC_00410]